MSSVNSELRLARAERTRAAMNNKAAKDPAPGDTPQARLLQAARAGQFEALVAEAQPAQPVAMVTAEEREAALRAAGRGPADGPAPAQEQEQEQEKKAKTTRKRKKKEPEPTPNEAYIAEHCRWVPLAERRSARRPRHLENRYLCEYDPITGEIVGDGYMHYEEDEDDAS